VPGRALPCGGHAAVHEVHRQCAGSAKTRRAVVRTLGGVNNRERLRDLAQRAGGSRAGAFLYVRVLPHLDRPLLRATGGRFSTSVGYPVLLLTTTGARSGEPRQTPLVYGTDGDRITLIASKGGATTHPAWLHNLRKNPKVTVLAGSRSGEYLASEAAGAERDRLWQSAVRFYRGYADYQRRAGDRQIPVVVLTPA
jgi:deazaflavin-dependent oxidoreductase (nitroreductase family)